MDSPRRCTRWLRSLQPPPPSWRRSDVEQAVEHLDAVLETLRVVSLVEGGRPTGRLAREARAGALDALAGCHALLSALDGS